MDGLLQPQSRKKMIKVNLKTSAVLFNRARSLVDEGYIFRVISTSPTLTFYKLVHRSNGNEIVIKGSPLDNWFTQSKNGKVVINRQPIV